MFRVPDAVASDSASGIRRFLALTFVVASLALAGAGCQSDPEARLAEIRAMQAAGQFDSSIQPLRVLLTTQSNHPEANYRLGVALMQTGRQSLAVWPLQKAAESQDYAVQSGLLLASALLATEAYEEAIRAADRVLAIDPDRVQALYTRANANIGAGRPAEALADAEHVLELRPDDSLAFAIRMGALIDLERLEEAEAAHKELKQLSEQVLAETGGDDDKAARACGTLAMFYAGHDRADEALATFDECMEKYPAHAMVRQWASDFYLRSGEADKTFDIWRRAIEESPEDLALRSKLADLYYDAGRPDEAKQVLIEGAELFDTRAAWQLLANLYRRTGEPAKAREALEKAIDRARGEPETLRFALGDLLVQEGDFERAEEVAASLKEPSYRSLLRGSILLAQNRPEEALKLLETGLRLWPNNAGARYLAARAALQSGDRTRAMAEFREAVRVDETETDASLELAKLYYADGKWQPARQFAERQISKRPFQGPEAHRIAARSAVRLGDYDMARRILENLKAYPGQDANAAVEFAAVQRARAGSQPAAEAIRSSGLDLTDPANVGPLSSLAQDLVSLGRANEAVEVVDRALAKNPESPELLDLMARIQLQRGAASEGRRYAERALRANPDHAPTLEVMGTLAARAGNEEEALGFFDRAAEADPSTGEYAYRAARIAQQMGRSDDADQRLRKITEDTPSHAGAANDLAWRLASREQELDLALSLAERASRIDRSANTLDTLGWVHLQRGDPKAALPVLEAAASLDPKAPSIQYRLGLAVARQGDAARAGELLRNALAGGDFPEAAEAQAELARLQGT